MSNTYPSFGRPARAVAPAALDQCRRQVRPPVGITTSGASRRCPAGPRNRRMVTVR